MPFARENGGCKRLVPRLRLNYIFCLEQMQLVIAPHVTMSIAAMSIFNINDIYLLVGISYDLLLLFPWCEFSVKMITNYNYLNNFQKKFYKSVWTISSECGSTRAQDVFRYIYTNNDANEIIELGHYEECSVKLSVSH